MAFSPQPFHDAVTQQDDTVNAQLAQQCGLSLPQVTYLRSEFKALGRNPFDSSLEILALEQGLDEEKVKHLFELHLSLLRRKDGFATTLDSS